MEAPSLAGSQKLQEHIWEQGRALAPGTSLRLEVTLLAACLRGQRPESESLSQLCLPSTWIEAFLVTMRFLRTQIRNCRIWSNWKYNGLLPLVALALSGSEAALWWLLSQLLRYSFCGICGNELEGLALVARGQKSLFPHWPTPYHLFCYTGVATLRRDILVVVRPFMTHHFYCGQECNPGMCTDTCKMDASPSGPSFGNTPGKLLCYPLGGVREKDKSNKGLSGTELKINLGCHQVPPWCISTLPWW